MVALVAVGCRPEAGVPDYSSHRGLLDGSTAVSLPGPFPYVEGEPRLFLGIHYETGRSETITINDMDRRYDVFAGYELLPTNDRVEGTFSDRLIYTGPGFWGGGLAWDDPRDLGGWTTMHISLKSAAETFDDVAFTVAYADAGGARQEATVSASDYGYVNDGEWHSLVIPLEDFAGADFTRVLSPLVMVGESGVSGEWLLIDDFYYTKE